MSEIHGKVRTSQAIGGKVKATSAVQGELDKDVKDRLYRDYNLLHNKPSIEGVELKGDKTLEELGIERFLYGTTEYWNSFPTLIGAAKTVYVYTDYEQDDQGNNIPGIKLGDGLGYLIDAPFTTDGMYDHIRNQVRHITAEERQFWNDKVRVYIDAENEERLVFTTD